MVRWNREYRTSADLVFPLLDLSELARLVYGLQVSLLLVLSELPHPGCRASAALVLLRRVLLALVRLVRCLLAFWVLVGCPLSASKLSKAMVGMAPVETVTPSALEYTAACGT